MRDALQRTCEHIRTQIRTPHGEPFLPHRFASNLAPGDPLGPCWRQAERASVQPSYTKLGEHRCNQHSSNLQPLAPGACWGFWSTVGLAWLALLQAVLRDGLRSGVVTFYDWTRRLGGVDFDGGHGKSHGVAAQPWAIGLAVAAAWVGLGPRPHVDSSRWRRLATLGVGQAAGCRPVVAARRERRTPDTAARAPIWSPPSVPPDSMKGRACAMLGHVRLFLRSGWRARARRDPSPLRLAAITCVAAIAAITWDPATQWVAAITWGPATRCDLATS